MKMMMLKEVGEYHMSCITYLQCFTELLRSVHLKVQCVGFICIYQFGCKLPQPQIRWLLLNTLIVTGPL